MSAPVKVSFVCSKCSAGYQAIQKVRPEKIKGSFQCEVCQNEIYQWCGNYAYFDWQPFETTHPRSLRKRNQAEYSIGGLYRPGFRGGPS